MKSDVIFKSTTIISERFACVDYNLVQTEMNVEDEYFKERVTR